MRLVFHFLLFFFCYQLSANTHLTTAIHELDVGESSSDETLLFLQNGVVAKLTSENKTLLKELISAKENGTQINFVLNEEREIISLESAKYQEPIGSISPYQLQNKNYQPTVVPSLENAETIYRTMRRGNLEESQCYNRAHVWSIDWKAKFNIDSTKIWIFFPRKYIRAYNFDWWFHVSPVLHVNMDGNIQERVADWKFTHSTLSVKEWTDVFMRNNSACTEIQTYAQYEHNRGESWCYLMRTNMFHYQPLDIINAEKDSKAKRYWWVEWEVRNAYRQAFGIGI